MEEWSTCAKILLLFGIDSSDSDFDEAEALEMVTDKTQRRLDGLLTEDDYGLNLLKVWSKTASLIISQK